VTNSQDDEAFTMMQLRMDVTIVLIAINYINRRRML